MPAAKTPSSEMPDAEALLEVVDTFPSPAAVGIEPAGEGLNIHFKELPPDDRSGSAGLFGFHAPDSWHAIGLTVEGRAVPVGDSFELPDDLDPSMLDSDGDISYSILVTRTGEFASRLRLQGDEIQNSWPNAGDFPDVPQGVSVDALHRVMGLASPGDEPPTALLMLSLWLGSVVEVLATTNRMTWSKAATLHPGFKGPVKVDPSVEMVAEAIVRSSANTSWERLRTRGASRTGTTMELEPHELRWMDATMYGRWVMSFQLDLELVIAALTAAGTGDVGRRIADVIDAVHERCAHTADPFYETRTA